MSSGVARSDCAYATTAHRSSDESALHDGIFVPGTPALIT